jgi:hypothetical protein
VVVIPAKAGIHESFSILATTQVIRSLAVIPMKLVPDFERGMGIQDSRSAISGELDSRFRGNDLSSYKF